MSISTFERAQVVADELDERRDGVGLGAHAALAELLGDPPVQLLLRDVEREDLPGLRAGLPERRARLQLVAPRARARSPAPGFDEVADDRVDVGRFPAALATSVAVCLRAVDVRDDDQPRVAEQAARVAETDRRLARRCRARSPISIASGSKWPRSRVSAVSIFGPSLPVIR